MTMIQVAVDRFMENREKLSERFRTAHPGEYKDIVRAVIEAVTDDEYSEFSPDPERIHEINDGNYQGTLLYVIGAKGYQPNNYWFVKVFYGSCSGCDTLESIRGYSDEPPTPEQVNDYMTLALHVVQELRMLQGDEV
jgi:hypothetical protein